ncbi:MAG: hypothetical protein SGBAC_012739, partial [Bacillariaceae sp.]
MDPYGLMESQPTKLLSSNSTAQTMETDDSSELPSIMGATSSSMEENEEVFFDPYTTNTLSSDDHSYRFNDCLYSTSQSQEEKEEGTSQAACSVASSRLEQAAEESSFYLQQEFVDAKSEVPLLFAKEDEKATRMEEAAKDISFYLQEEFHDAKEAADEDIILDPTTYAQDSPLTEPEQFQDCQDDDSIDHESITPSSVRSSQGSQASSTDVSFYLQEAAAREGEIVNLEKEADVSFYLQEAAPQEDNIVNLEKEADASFYLEEATTQDDQIVDLEKEDCPSTIPDKIASFSQRLDMDGAIRHKTVFYKDQQEMAEELPDSSAPISEEKEEEVAAPMHALSTSATVNAATPECTPEATAISQATSNLPQAPPQRTIATL